jgi:NADPH-dependent curcumin reductase CurA
MMKTVLLTGTAFFRTASIPGSSIATVFRRTILKGCMVIDWAAEFPGVRWHLAEFLNDGRLASREGVRHGLATTSATLQRLFTGGDPGKQILALN